MGNQVQISLRSLAPENLSPTVWRCSCHPKFSRFDTIPACDGQTVRQVRTHAHARVHAHTHRLTTYCVSIALRGNHASRNIVLHYFEQTVITRSELT